jgi:hypothetical protein
VEKVGTEELIAMGFIFIECIALEFAANKITATVFFAKVSIHNG